MRLNEDEGTTTSWLALKDQGRVAFERGDYETALSKYGAALQPLRECPLSEQPLILSNIVAARLKIGGPAQAEAAVEAAKKCIALNDRWAKGHFRLASAYIALGGHSNDACNSLQRVLQLDSSFPTARQLLIRELRRGHAPPTTEEQLPTPSAPPEELDTPTPIPPGTTTTPTAPPEHLDERNYSSSSTANAYSSSSTPQNTTPTPPPLGPTVNPYRDPHPQQFVDDTLSWQERIGFYVNRARHWYLGQSNDVRTILKVGVFFLLLYVAFGGRFGLTLMGNGSTSTNHRRGNYDAGNVYDQYYQGRLDEAKGGDTSNSYSQSRTAYHSSSSSSSSSRNSNSRYDPYESNSNYHHDDSYGSSNRRRNSNRGSTSFHFPNLMDGSPQSILILGGLIYLCQRNGINPFQAIFFLNMMNGGRGRHRVRRFGGGGFGMGGGMGGFGRRRW